MKNTSEDDHSTCPLNSCLPLMIQKVLPISKAEPSPSPLNTEACPPTCVVHPMQSQCSLMTVCALLASSFHRITKEPKLEGIHTDHQVQLLSTSRFPLAPNPSQPCLLIPEATAEHSKKGKKGSLGLSNPIPVIAKHWCSRGIVCSVLVLILQSSSHPAAFGAECPFCSKEWFSF